MGHASEGQLSFFSADAHPRAVTDLEGVLCGRGQLSVFGRGTTARLSIVLGAPSLVVAADGDEAADGEPADDDAADDEPAAPEVDLADLDPADLDPADFDPADFDPADLDPADPDLDVDPADVAPGPDAVPFHRSVERDTEDVGDGAGNHDAGDQDAGDHDAGDQDAGDHDAGPRFEYRPDPVVEWRAHALCCAFRTRGVDAEIDRLDDGRPVVRSAYRADLVPLARAWTRGAVKAVPADLELDGPRLRLWILAAGRQHGPAYLLGLDPHAPGTHQTLLAASRRAGLGATLGGDRAEPVLRIVGRRRQARLAELAGGRPSSTVDGVWPG